LTSACRASADFSTTIFAGAFFAAAFFGAAFLGAAFFGADCAAALRVAPLPVDVVALVVPPDLPVDLLADFFAALCVDGLADTNYLSV
jgi:hypothetical protein